MKIRNGFVSNSSSSSFLIAVKVGTTLSTKKANGLDVSGLDFLEHIRYMGKPSSEETMVKMEGVAHSIREIKGWYGDNKDTEKMIKDIEKKIAKKKINDENHHVALIEISYHDPLMGTLYGYLLKKRRIVELANLN